MSDQPLKPIISQSWQALLGCPSPPNTGCQAAQTYSQILLVYYEPDCRWCSNREKETPRLQSSSVQITSLWWKTRCSFISFQVRFGEYRLQFWHQIRNYLTIIVMSYMYVCKCDICNVRMGQVDIFRQALIQVYQIVSFIFFATKRWHWFSCRHKDVCHLL